MLQPTRCQLPASGGDQHPGTLAQAPCRRSRVASPAGKTSADTRVRLRAAAAVPALRAVRRLCWSDPDGNGLCQPGPGRGLAVGPEGPFVASPTPSFAHSLVSLFHTRRRQRPHTPAPGGLTAPETSAGGGDEVPGVRVWARRTRTSSPKLTARLRPDALRWAEQCPQRVSTRKSCCDPTGHGGFADVLPFRTRP